MIVLATVLLCLCLVGMFVGLALSFSKAEPYGVCLVIACCTALGIGLVCLIAGDAGARQEAIKAGAAEYKVTPNEEGAAKVEFVWKGTSHE